MRSEGVARFESNSGGKGTRGMVAGGGGVLMTIPAAIIVVTLPLLRQTDMPRVGSIDIPGIAEQLLLLLHTHSAGGCD